MTEPTEIRIARWTRQTREAQGLSVDDIVSLSGVSPGVIYAIESGVGTTRLANVAAVVETLGGNLGVVDGTSTADADQADQVG